MGIEATIHETMDMDDMKLDCHMGVISPRPDAMPVL